MNSLMCFHVNWKQDSIWVECFHYLLDCYQILWKNLNSNFHLQQQDFGLRFFFFQFYKHGFHLEYFLDDSLILEVMLESDFTFSFAIAEFIISGFSIKCESKPSTVGLLNINFFVNNLHYNSFYEISAFISSGHSSWNIQVYFLNITVLTFDVPNVINSRNNNRCKWSNSVWKSLFIGPIVSFIITLLISRDN